MSIWGGGGGVVFEYMGRWGEGGGGARNALAEFGHDAEIEDERRGEQRVLARVVHDKRVLAAHEDLARVPRQSVTKNHSGKWDAVLVHGALAVADIRHISEQDVTIFQCGKGRGIDLMTTTWSGCSSLAYLCTD